MRRLAGVVLCLLPLAGWGYQYDPTLLKIQAKLAPRLLMMSDGVRFHSKERFTICLVHEKGDSTVPAFFREQLERSYPDGLQGRKLEVVTARYETVRERCAESEMLYLFKGNREQIREVTSFAQKHAMLTMAYSSEDLADGVLLSVYIGRNVRPYLNLSGAKASGIHFSSDLKRISKFWSAGEMP